MYSRYLTLCNSLFIYLASLDLVMKINFYITKLLLYYYNSFTHHYKNIIYVFIRVTTIRTQQILNPNETPNQPGSNPYICKYTQLYLIFNCTPLPLPIREYPIRTDVTYESQIRLKLITINLSVNSLVTCLLTVLCYIYHVLLSIVLNDIRMYYSF